LVVLVVENTIGCCEGVQ